MRGESIHELDVDVEAVRAAIGGVPRVAYEAAHVYPLSAPQFVANPRAPRENPPGGVERLYVHVPFCRYACSFCFYAKRVNTPRAQMERYVDALRRELDALAGAGAPRQVYVGGGTPTALPPALLDRALTAATAGIDAAHAGCHTVECSPESLTDEHVDVLRRRGVGRASLGVQTLDEAVLRAVNRQHDAQQALAAAALLVASGLSVNVDLMYGFNGQDETALRRDVEAFAALGVQSLTVYHLRLNEHTPRAAAADDLRRVDLATLMRWRRLIETVTGAAGYAQTRWHVFEHRDHAASGHDRAPGMNAFGVGREIGIGVSAFSHLGETIYRNHGGLEEYVQRIERGESPVEDVFRLGPLERRTLFVARTLGDGRRLDLAAYEQTFGAAFEDHYGAVLARLHGAGLVRETAGQLELSEIGRLVYDLVTLAFYPDDARNWLDRRQQPAPSQGVGARRSAAAL